MPRERYILLTMAVFLAVITGVAVMLVQQIATFLPS